MAFVISITKRSFITNSNSHQYNLLIAISPISRPNFPQPRRRLFTSKQTKKPQALLDARANQSARSASKPSIGTTSSPRAFQKRKNRPNGIRWSSRASPRVHPIRPARVIHRGRQDEPSSRPYISIQAADRQKQLAASIGIHAWATGDTNTYVSNEATSSGLSPGKPASAQTRFSTSPAVEPEIIIAARCGSNYAGQG